MCSSDLFPVGHHATLLVALPHTLAAPGSLPGGLPTRASVVRGWTATVERASRILTPDPRWNERVVAERCELALAGPAHPDDDPVGFLIGLGQLVRIGERDVDGWAPDLAHALELAGKSAVRGPGGDDWAFEAAVDAADAVLDSMGDQRARRDLATLRAHVSGPRVVGSTTRAAALPDDEPVDGARFLAWIERRIVLPSGVGADRTADLLSLGYTGVPGVPDGWLGANFEAYGLPTGTGSTVSVAVRWHGTYPALLWEQTGEPVRLTASVAAPGWSDSSATGETLWPEPSV